MNWKRTIGLHLACLSASLGLAAAQSPQIIWQTPASLDRSYRSLKFTADNSQLMAGGELRNASASGVLLRRFDSGSGAVLAETEPSFIYYGANEIALSPDQQRIATANLSTRCTAQQPPVCEGGYLFYNAEPLERIAAPAAGNAPNYTVDYAPDGQLIALGGLWYNYAPVNYDNIRLVRSDTGEIERTLPGHLRAPNDGGTLRVRFSPDGTLLGSVGRDSFVKIWRVADGALLQAINFPDAYMVDSVAFSPDGQFIAAGRTGYDAEVRVWRVDTGALVRTFAVSASSTSTTFNRVAWTPDGAHVVAGISFGVGYGENKIRFWNFETGELAQEYSSPADRFIYDLTFSTDGEKFAWTASSQIFVAANPVAAARPISVVSRKLHNGLVCDVPLPLTGSSGIEPRSGGSTGDHLLAITFSSPVSVNGTPQAQVTSGIGQVGNQSKSNDGAVTVNGSTVFVPLTNVSNAQALTITLSGVTRGAVSRDIAVPFRVLLGDTNASGSVNATDLGETKARAGQPLDALNFRHDVNASGAINASDLGLMKAAAGTTLP